MVEGAHDLHLPFEVLPGLPGGALLQHFDGHQGHVLLRPRHHAWRGEIGAIIKPRTLLVGRSYINTMDLVWIFRSSPTSIPTWREDIANVIGLRDIGGKKDQILNLSYTKSTNQVQDVYFWDTLP